MKTYTVHYPPESGVSMTGLARDAILVKDGFSWPAFLVPFIWLIYNRMWIVLAIYVAAEIALAAIAAGLSLPEGLTMVASLALSFIIGFQGNDFHRWSLERRRFKQHAVVAGASLPDAEHRFFANAEHLLRQAGAPA